MLGGARVAGDKGQVSCDLLWLNSVVSMISVPSASSVLMSWQWAMEKQTLNPENTEFTEGAETAFPN